MIPPPANQSRSSPGEGVILKQGISKEKSSYNRNLLICSSQTAGPHSLTHTHGGRQLSCPVLHSPGQTLMLTQHILMHVCVFVPHLPRPTRTIPSTPFLLRSRMHASPTWARGDAADAPPHQPALLCQGRRIFPGPAPENKKLPLPYGLPAEGGGPLKPCLPCPVWRNAQKTNRSSNPHLNMNTLHY